MSDLAQLPRRVTDLEERMDDVQDLARRTGEEVANWRGTLNNHTQLLNGMSDKIELFKKRVDKRFDEVDMRFDGIDMRFNGIDERFDKLEGEMRNGFAEVERKFELLRKGQEQITDLLTRHLGEPDEETGRR